MNKFYMIVKLTGGLKWLSTVILFFSFSWVYSQTCISGRITDSLTKQGIEGANVRIEKSGGMVSGKNGAFKICQLPGRSFILTVTHLGYHPVSKLITNVKDGGLTVEILMSPNSIVMQEMVVSATRTEKAVLDIPVRVNSLGPRALETSPSHNIDEILQVIPGININRPFGNLSTKATVTMRGLSGKEQARVLILVDGIPVNKSDGGTVDWNMLDPSSLAKIEVAKGAGSALYGGSAMGGVINLVTKQPGKDLSGQLSLEYGTFQTLGARINLGKTYAKSGSDRQYYWLANAFCGQSDGYITQSKADQAANPYITKSNMKELGLMMKAGIEWNKNQKLEMKIQRYDDDRGTGEKVYQKEGNTTEHDSYGITVSYSGKYKSFQVNSSAYFLEEDYKKVNEYLKDDYTWYDVLSVRRDLGWVSYMTAEYQNRHRLTAGFDLKQGSVDAYDKYYTSSDIVYNEGKMLTYAFFAQDEVKIWRDKISLMAGIRYDQSLFYDGSFRIDRPTRETDFMRSYEVPVMPEKSNAAVSPRLSLQYKWTSDDRVYLLYSRGFRPSVLDDLCRSGRIKGGFKIANPAIKPEFLDNYESGLDLLVLKKIKTSLSVYYSTGKDFQYYVSNGQTIDMGFGDRPIFIRSNISKIEVMGAEAEISYEWNKQLQLFANYGYNHSVIKDYRRIAGTDTIDLTNKYLTDVPTHVISMGGYWKNKWLNLSLTIRYTGTMWVNDQNTVDEVLLRKQYPAYTTVDTKCWKEFLSHYQIALTVQNVFDQIYYDSKEAVCPGRYITGSFTYKF